MVDRQRRISIFKARSLLLDEQTDAVLVQEVLGSRSKASTRAYGVLVQRHENKVRNFLRYLTKQADRADDLAQEAFLNAWEKLATLEDAEKFGSWVQRIAYRLFLHEERHAKVIHRHAESERVVHEITSPSLEAAAPGLEAAAPGIEAAAPGLEEVGELEKLLTGCDANEAELLVLVYGFGFTIAEVASERGIAEGTVKSLLHRAKHKIRDHHSLAS